MSDKDKLKEINERWDIGELSWEELKEDYLWLKETCNKLIGEKRGIGMIQLEGKYTNAVVYTKAEPLENAIEQIQQLIDSEVAEGTKVRIMPDYHAGKGCVIGTTMVLNGKVSPSLVGVDIGCGVLCYKFKTDEEINFGFLDNYIRRTIPHGRDNHMEFSDIRDREWFHADKFKAEGLDNERINRSIGTLGGGNHFIEIGKDSENNYYLFVHTGSRYLGAKVAKYYTDLAVMEAKKRNVIEVMSTETSLIEVLKDTYKVEKVVHSFLPATSEEDNTKREEGKKYFKEFVDIMKETGRQNEISSIIKAIKEKVNSIVIKDKSLCYLEGENYDNYLHDMELAQKFAKTNRMLIANTIMLEIGYATTLERFDSIHNYIDIENGILRKGAISAQEGQRLLIPLNMRDGVIVGVGKGNADWNYSAPHGAGRIQSRTMSRKEFNLEDFKESMKGIYTTCVDEETIDESPNAYKPIEHILDVINETIDVECIVKPVYNFKAVE